MMALLAIMEEDQKEAELGNGWPLQSPILVAADEPHVIYSVNGKSALRPGAAGSDQWA